MTRYFNRNFKHPVRLFIDNGADINIIQISELNGRVIICEDELHRLEGVSDSPFIIIGTVTTHNQIENAIFNIKFDVVDNSFPVPRSGLIGF